MESKTNTQYKTIWNAQGHDHDREELLSETDVESGHEKQWHSDELGVAARENWDHSRGTNTISSKIKENHWIINTSLLVVIVGLLTVLLVREPRREQIGSDFSGSHRQFSTSVIKWNADEAFVPMTQPEWFSEAITAQWNTLMPAGTSPPGGPNGTRFSTTSMTHSLHCLFMMGRMYSALQDNRPELLEKDSDTHYFHCIDYMRQAVMCAGDVALEPHSENDGPDNGPLDGGWNGIHVCKNYDEVINYLEHQIVDGVRVVLPIDD